MGEYPVDSTGDKSLNGVECVFDFQGFSQQDMEHNKILKDNKDDICRAFLRGTVFCKQMFDCRYSHPALIRDYNHRCCWSFSAGTCQYGDKCIRPHHVNCKSDIQQW